MAFWIQFVNRYARTFFDFWCLRPRRFYNAKSSDSKNYLTPYEFLVGSLSIGFPTYFTAFSLAQSKIHEVSGQPPVSGAEALAIQFLALLVVLLFVNALLFRAVSRIWPVGGSASFSSIFEIQCYMMAIYLPAMIMDLLLGPTLTGLLARQMVTPLSSLIPFLLGLVLGVFGLVFWNLPGVALANGVSTRRMWAGYLFWISIIVVGGAVCITALRLAG